MAKPINSFELLHRSIRQSRSKIRKMETVQDSPCVKSLRRSKLDRLISNLCLAKFHVADQKMLLKSLTCLRDTIGNADLKQDIASYVSNLIMYRDKLHRDELDKTDMPILHTVIYGSPGTGKTLLSKILASVWCSIGLLGNQPDMPASKRKTYKMEYERMQLDKNQINVPMVNPVACIVWFSIAYIAYRMIDVLWARFNPVKEASTAESNVVKIVLTVGVCFAVYKAIFMLTSALYSDRVEPRELGTTSKKAEAGNPVIGADGVVNGDSKRSPRSFYQKYADVLASDLVVYCSPADFIGKYLGHTAQKTRELMQLAIGKVLFVDEAYSFITRSDNMFGKEALNEMTNFLDAHPGELILVFAGYEKDLREGVFAVQKGLDRRFGLQLTCNGYTKRELFKMFCNRLASRSVKMAMVPECYAEFARGEYTYMAGDINRMIDYVMEPLAHNYLDEKVRSALLESEHSDATDMTSEGEEEEDDEDDEDEEDGGVEEEEEDDEEEVQEGGYADNSTSRRGISNKGTEHGDHSSGYGTNSESGNSEGEREESREKHSGNLLGKRRRLGSGYYPPDVPDKSSGVNRETLDVPMEGTDQGGKQVECKGAAHGGEEEEEISDPKHLMMITPFKVHRAVAKLNARKPQARIDSINLSGLDALQRVLQHM